VLDVENAGDNKDDAEWSDEGMAMSDWFCFFFGYLLYSLFSFFHVTIFWYLQ
jgi:hypothetical protein